MPAAMDPLGLAKVFIKTVVRMFYETEHIVIIDALVFHGACVMGRNLSTNLFADER
jgi:transcription initiation factor TFIIE subunit alpha